jgi:hypothetical protein
MGSGMVLFLQAALGLEVRVDLRDRHKTVVLIVLLFEERYHGGRSAKHESGGGGCKATI